MNCCRPFAFVAMFALMLCSVVQAQDAPARGGRGRQQADPAAQAQRVRLTLLGLEEVQAALNFEDAALEELTEALKVAMPARGGRGGRGGAGGGQAAPEGDRDAAVATIEKLLDDEKSDRLNGIVIQALNGRALQDAIIAGKLEISEEQAGEIKTVFDDSIQAMRDARDADGGGQPDREAMTELTDKANAAAIAVLTDNQQAEFEKMAGEAIELSEAASRLARGGGRGGAGGGRGGAAGGRGGAGGGRGGAGGGRGNAGGAGGDDAE